MAAVLVPLALHLFGWRCGVLRLCLHGAGVLHLTSRSTGPPASCACRCPPRYARRRPVTSTVRRQVNQSYSLFSVGESVARGSACAGSVPAVANVSGRASASRPRAFRSSVFGRLGHYVRSTRSACASVVLAAYRCFAPVLSRGGHQAPNISVNWTACKLRLQVPSALRASAASYLNR